MRRIQFIKRDSKPVSIKAHPNFYNLIEEVRKKYDLNGIKISQVEATNIISSRISIPQINLLGVNNDKFKKR
ncbi:MAG: hypothetical protein WC758_08270 [Candidatus Woesearchaeota archaeon]|jgi:hypothetical protein